MWFPVNAFVLVILPVVFAPVLLASLADAYAQPTGSALLMAIVRGVLIRMPTPEGGALLLVALALLNWVRCRMSAPAADEAWELLDRAAALESANHIEAALISYEHVARKFPDHPAAEAARLSWDALQMSERETRPSGSETSKTEPKTEPTLRWRLMRLRPLVHP